MDPITMLVIAAIVAAIILVEVNKQQQTKATDHAHINTDLQQAYLLKAAEYKISTLEDFQKNNNTSPDIEQELLQLKNAFENGNIQLKEFNLKLDILLHNFDVNNGSIAQAC